MKTISKPKIEMIETLYKVIEARKSLEKQEKLLKDEIKSIMGDESLLEGGDYIVSLKMRLRKDLDKDAIMHDLGLEFFKKYETKTEYSVMDICLKALTKGA